MALVSKKYREIQIILGSSFEQFQRAVSIFYRILNELL